MSTTTTNTTATHTALVFDADGAADLALAAAGNAVTAATAQAAEVAAQAAARAASHGAECVSRIADLMAAATPAEMLEISKALERAAAFSALATHHAADAARIAAVLAR